MSVRTVGDLRKLIDGKPDDMPLVRPAEDHEYRQAYAQVTTALKGRGGAYTEDHGEEVTPEAQWGKRVPVLLIE